MHVNEGIPMLKPLVYYDQEDLQTHYRTDEFIYGNQILVCPILEPNAVRRLYLPVGIISGQMSLVLDKKNFGSKNFDFQIFVKRRSHNSKISDTTICRSN
jgi:hypothetical protein